MISLLFMWACGGEVENKSTNSNFQPLQQQIEKQLEKEKQEKKEISISGEFKQDVLSPSPLETQKTVQKAGISICSMNLLRNTSTILKETQESKQIIRVGVLLCDVIVSIEHASKEEVIQKFSNIIEGMATMKVGIGLMDMIKEMHTQYANDAITKKELVEGLDNIVAMSVPEDGFSKDDPTGPLLQAGAWLQGVDLVSQAILKEDKIEVANQLLRLEHVATLFLQYANGEGKEKTTEQILDQMKTSLTYLQTLAKKKR